MTKQDLVGGFKEIVKVLRGESSKDEGTSKQDRRTKRTKLK